VAEPWSIVYYKDADGRVPVFDYFIESGTVKLIAFLNAVLDSVAAAPPPAFSGGGHWEAMRGDMAGYFEAKAIGPDRHHHRVFCILENSDDDKETEARGLAGNKSIAVITGMWKRTRRCSPRATTPRSARSAMTTSRSGRGGSPLPTTSRTSWGGLR
jgi:hypothetical protein